MNRFCKTSIYSFGKKHLEKRLIIHIQDRTENITLGTGTYRLL